MPFSIRTFENPQKNTIRHETTSRKMNGVSEIRRDQRTNSKDAPDDANVCPWDVRTPGAGSEVAAAPAVDGVCPWDVVVPAPPAPSGSGHAPLPRTGSEETAPLSAGAAVVAARLSSSAPANSGGVPMPTAPVPTPLKLLPVVITSQPMPSQVPEIRVHSVSSIDEEPATPKETSAPREVALEKTAASTKPVIVSVQLKKGAQVCV
jgi:hypothetical protein